MDETDEHKFKQMVETAVVEMKEKASTKEFREYFETNYKCRCEQWANSFRVTSGVNPNMYVCRGLSSYSQIQISQREKKQTVRQINSCPNGVFKT